MQKVGRATLSLIVLPTPLASSLTLPATFLAFSPRLSALSSASLAAFLALDLLQQSIYFRPAIGQPTALGGQLSHQPLCVGLPNDHRILPRAQSIRGLVSQPVCSLLNVPACVLGGLLCVLHSDSRVRGMQLSWLLNHERNDVLTRLQMFSLIGAARSLMQRSKRIICKGYACSELASRAS